MSALSNHGGEGGIRTHEELAPLAVFKTAALVRYATSPINGGGGGIRTHVSRKARRFSKPVHWTTMRLLQSKPDFNKKSPPVQCELAKVIPQTTEAPFLFKTVAASFRVAPVV